MKKSSPIFGINCIDKEPWVDLPSEDDFAKFTKEENIIFNQTLRQKFKYLFYIQTFDFFTGNNIKGDYYEFGSHRGRTFRMALSEARRRNFDFMNFYSFDSFEGLPDSTEDHNVVEYTKGALSTSEEEFHKLVKSLGIYQDKIHTHKGFYDKSLTKELQAKFVSSGRKIALVNVDCDLYESAVPVFNFIEPLLQEGTVIYIDDFFAGYNGSPARGVPKAFKEFQERSKFKFIEHLQVGWTGRSFISY